VHRAEFTVFFLDRYVWAGSKGGGIERRPNELDVDGFAMHLN
jgi:hypothetical protein